MPISQSFLTGSRKKELLDRFARRRNVSDDIIGQKSQLQAGFITTVHYVTWMIDPSFFCELLSENKMYVT